MSNLKRFRVGPAAEYLGVSPRSLASRGWRLKHGITAIKIGRAIVFDQGTLDAYLSRHRERAFRQDEDADRKNGGGA